MKIDCTPSFFTISVNEATIDIRINAMKEEKVICAKLSHAISAGVQEVKIDTTFLAYGVVTTTTPSNSLLLPAQSVVSSYDFGLCGSQLPSMQWSYSLPTFYSALRKLLSFKRPTLENVVYHLLWLCSDGGGSIRDIERVYTALNDSLAHTNDNSTLKDLLFEKRVLLLEDRKTLVAPKSVFAYVFFFIILRKRINSLSISGTFLRM